MKRNVMKPALICAAVIFGISIWLLVDSYKSLGAQPDDAPAVVFTAAPGSPVETSPMTGRPAVGDLNGDGWPDIVVAAGTC